MHLGEFLKVSKEKKKVELHNICVYYLEKFYPLLKDASKFNHKQIKETYNLLYDEGLIGAFLEDVEIFAKRVKISPIDKVAKQFSQVIFEQGQGLGIDKEADKTYGTPTRTGSTIPIKYLMLFDKLNMIDSVNRYYVTRSYITRHGDGELPDEDTAYEFKHGVKDKTNVHNIYQGSIRFAPLTIKGVADLAARINKDIQDNNIPDINIKNSLANMNIKDNLVMTHYTNKSIRELKAISNFIISPSCEVYVSTQEDKELEKAEKIFPLYPNIC
jgi:adenylosuccinate synthase